MIGLGDIAHVQSLAPGILKRSLNMTSGYPQGREFTCLAVNFTIYTDPDAAPFSGGN